MQQLLCKDNLQRSSEVSSDEPKANILNFARTLKINYTIVVKNTNFVYEYLLKENVLTLYKTKNNILFVATNLFRFNSYCKIESIN